MDSIWIIILKATLKLDHITELQGERALSMNTDIMSQKLGTVDCLVCQTSVQ